MATFIERTEIGARGTTVAVKELIDLDEGGAVVEAAAGAVLE